MNGRTTTSLEDECRSLRALVGHLMAARDDERFQLARDLHDDATQRLAFLQFETQRLQQSSPAEMRAGLERIGKEAGELATGLRNVSQQLYPAAIEHLGLPSALRMLSDHFRGAGLEMVLLVADIDDLQSLGTSLALYRIAETALGNVLKHAPAAIASLRLRAVEQDLELSIANDGPGFDESLARSNGALGLLAMEERARMAGGSFTLQSSPSEGTMVVVRVPVKPL